MDGWIPSDPRGRLEPAVEALIPPARRQARPIVPLLAPAAPQPQPPADAGLLVLDLARLDASGRFTSRTVMAALHWGPHQPVDLSVSEQSVLFTVAATGRSAVGGRGELAAVPAPARTSAGLTLDARVALVAVPSRQLLILHPPALLTGLLAAYYATQDAATGRDRP